MANVTPVVKAADLAGLVKRSKSEVLHDKLAFDFRARRLPPFESEHRFARELERQWRMDFAFLEHKVAVEIEGLVYKRVGGELVCTGRHSSPEGFREDCRKYAAAASLGWFLIRVERDMVKSGEAADLVVRLLAARGWQQ